MTPLRQRMDDAMLQRGFAASTRANYVKAIRSMAKYYRRDPAQYSASEVQAYLLHMVKDRHVSFSSMNQTACAARFLYETVLGHDRETFHIPHSNGQGANYAARIALTRRNRPYVCELLQPCASHGPANHIRHRPACL